MTWDNRDVLPVRGPAARARTAVSEGNRERSPVAPVVFPRCRCDTRDVGPGLVPGRFPRQQRFTATLGAVTTFAEVARFSGRPDRIDLHSSAAGVEFQYRNRGGDTVPGPVVRAAGAYETDASFDLVDARDPAGAGGQLVTVIGYWSAESLYD